MLGCFVFWKANKIILLLLLLLYCTLISSHKLLFSPAIVDFHLVIACLQSIVCLGERAKKKKNNKQIHLSFSSWPAMFRFVYLLWCVIYVCVYAHTQESLFVWAEASPDSYCLCWLMGFFFLLFFFTNCFLSLISDFFHQFHDEIGYWLRLDSIKMFPEKMG